MSKVLFISIPFYEYTDTIMNAIEDVLSCDVDLLLCEDEWDKQTYLMSKITHGTYKKTHDTRLQEKFFAAHMEQKYDDIFVLVGRGLDADLFASFLDAHSEARKILYLWDDVARLQNFSEIYKYFDHIYSFDPNDCKEYGFEFLPLFYCRPYDYQGELKEYDISVSGFLHSDRLDIIQAVLTQFPYEQYKWNALIKTTRAHVIMEKIHRRLPIRTPFYISYKLNSMKENANILKASKTVIDIPHPSQKGLSIRTFEALAAHTKIITTNKEVVNYDFYNPDNILLIDRKNPVVDPDFIVSPYRDVDPDIINKYSLDVWVRKIFEVV